MIIFDVWSYKAVPKQQ